MHIAILKHAKKPTLLEPEHHNSRVTQQLPLCCALQRSLPAPPGTVQPSWLLLGSQNTSRVFLPQAVLQQCWAAGHHCTLPCWPEAPLAVPLLVSSPSPEIWLPVSNLCIPSLDLCPPQTEFSQAEAKQTLKAFSSLAAFAMFNVQMALNVSKITGFSSLGWKCDCIPSLLCRGAIAGVRADPNN